MTYSVHLRKKVLAIKDKEKLSFAKISERFGIGKNTIFSWTKRLHPLKHRNKPPTKIQTDQLKIDVDKHSDSYQYERAERLGVSRSGIQKALTRLNITYKKSSKTPEGKRRR